jgi:hypothetical protein
LHPTYLAVSKISREGDYDMALDLRVAVNKAVVDLRREISKKTSDLASLNSELTRYQKVQGILNNQSRTTRTKATEKSVENRSIGIPCSSGSLALLVSAQFGKGKIKELHPSRLGKVG